MPILLLALFFFLFLFFFEFSRIYRNELKELLDLLRTNNGRIWFDVQTASYCIVQMERRRKERELLWTGKVWKHMGKSLFSQPPCDIIEVCDNRVWPLFETQVPH